MNEQRILLKEASEMTNNILFVTIILTIIVTKANLQNNSTLSPIVVAANYNELYEGSVNSKIDNIFAYKRNVNNFLKKTRVIVESNATFNFPLHIIVNQKNQVFSWQIPLSRNSNYTNSSRTLCTSNQNSTNNEETITITLSTLSNSKVSFKLKLLTVEDFHIRTGEVRKNIRITPSEPAYYSYSFDEKSESKSVIVQLISDSKTCMIFSIQNKSCSILDVEKNIKYADLWQTVSHKGAITVSKNNFPNGFFIVLVGKTDDSNCFEVEPSKMLLSLSKREKFVTLTINSGHVKNDYLFACILYISAILGFVIIYIVSSLLYYKKFKYTKYILNQQDDYTIDLDKVENLITDKKLTKIQVLCVSDLSKKEPVDLSERSRLYMYYLVTVSVFYILPVLQLVTTNQINVEESGNQDICYYNFFCAQPFGFLSSFNNVFSNFGYTLFGILFIIITRLREKYNDINRQTLYGIPQHYGLYYAMGIALVMEGVLSACYHICPSHNNLQFDTSFMYIITVLCMVKLYQIRHPDTHAKAPVTFGVLALIILLALIGVIDSSLPFRIIFTVMHLIFFSYLIAEVYSLGRRRFFGGYFSSFYFSIKYDFHKIREEDYSFFYVLKFMFFLMALASNVSLAIYSSLFYNKNFNMYLLGILMLNLVLYLIFYCFMKYCAYEKILLQPSIFIILTILTWFGAFYFYLMRSTSSDLSAAESRNYNKPCLVLNFFDSHDIWHFLSALAMFFSFMILLTIDDDLINVPRNQIPVF